MIGRVAILVLGMHRSGTSAVTGGISRLGIDLGSKLLAPGEDNPKGYFEHQDAVRIDEKLLHGLERDWDDVRPLPDGWQDSEAASAANQEINALVSGEFSQSRVFAIKDPRMCLLLPVWLGALRAAEIEPRILMVARHPAEVAASIYRRNGWPSIISEHLWLQYMLTAERDSRSCRRTSITYDQLIDNPAAVLNEALAALGVRDSQDRAGDESLVGFVTSADRHHKGGSGLRSGTHFDVLAEQAYGCFAQQAINEHDPSARLDAINNEFESILQPLSGHVDALADATMLMRRKFEAMEVELARTHSDLNSQLAWSEQAVGQREVLQSELAEVRSELNAQLAWSEKAVEEREALQAKLAEAQSELRGQLVWAKQAVETRESLQADLFRARSDLHDQKVLVDQALAKQEAADKALAVATQALESSLRAAGELEKQLALKAAELVGVQSRESRKDGTTLGRLNNRWIAWVDRRATKSKSER